MEVPHTMPSPTHFHPSATSGIGSDGGSKKRHWRSRLPFISPPLHDSGGTLAQEVSNVSTNTSSGRRSRWWKIRLFQGMIDDVRRRAPYYWSDWKDAWDYRVVPATVYMYFANILPALAFSLDMFTKTASSYGVNEVLLASVLGSVVFAILACQPLVIVGVTGTVIPTVADEKAVSYCLTYVTRFSCDIFGFYVAFVYLQKGIQVLTRQWAAGEPAAYLSIVVALLVLIVAYLCGIVGGSSLFQRYVRKFIEDYGTSLTIIFFTGFVHVGRMRSVELQTLPTSKAFFPTQDRSWFIHFWDIDVSDVFIAIPFAILLTILFYFDHNGIPFPNGLIPQAPFHTNSLCVTRQASDESETGAGKGHTTRMVDHVVEQRVSNLGQGLLTLGTMSGPLLIVLHLIPRGVLAGLFFVMGVQALEGNGITLKMVYLARDRSLTSAADPLSRIQRKRAVWYFVALELFGFGATFAITQTIAAIGFPIIILILVPVRTFLLPKYFTREELSILDAPTASPFTMESVGGNHGEDVAVISDDPGVTDRPQSSEKPDEDDTIERGEAGKTTSGNLQRGLRSRSEGVVSARKGLSFSTTL
ncbi:MAG: hypothetical protein Q9201_000075 [Fulgogasparrea decipioides]